MTNFKTILRSLKYYPEIKKSSLFDKDFYLNTYDDVKGDPILHYLFKGYKKKYFPSLKFDSDLYYEMYPDILENKLNPLVHYLSKGKNEGRKFKEVPIESKKKEICNTNLALLDNFQFDREPLVSIIILNRNGLNHLKRLFKDFSKKTNYSNYEIIVVDNASDDESVNYLNSLDLPIKIIQNDVNLSFSKSNNEAVKVSKGEFVLLLNNDIEPTYGWLNQLVGTILKDDNIAMVGAKLVFPFYFNDLKEKSFTIQHSGDMFAERMKPCCVYAVNKSNSNLDIFDSSLNKTEKVIAVTAAVAIIRKDIYLEVGGLDEEYNYGLEDVDFSLKLYKKGYSTVYSGSTLLFHHESSTRVKTKDYELNDKKNYDIFLKKWNSYLTSKLLIDKIHNDKFFSKKRLKIAIVGEYNKYISKIAQDFSKQGFEVVLISNNYYLGDSTDILISFKKDYDLSKIIARKNIFKVAIDFKDDNYDLNLNTGDNILEAIKEDVK